jgi:ribosomal protein S18 acetylase RimI-like enzyme
MHLPAIVLAPMGDTEFARFKALAISTHAEDNVTATRWSEPNALARAEAEFQRLLPQGLQTRDHRLCEIRDAAQGLVVGYLWFAFTLDGPVRSGYLYNVHVLVQHRGRGYAKAALDGLEDIARAERLATLRLHAFSCNAAAQALYRSQGYWITGVNMQKRLREDEH